MTRDCDAIIAGASVALEPGPDAGRRQRRLEGQGDGDVLDTGHRPDGRAHPLEKHVLQAVMLAPPQVPPAIDRTKPARVIVPLTMTEEKGTLAGGVEYTFWTFGGSVPGPFVRVRAGDTVEIRLTNATSSHNAHSIDLHSVTGPGGGATVTQLSPGETGHFEWKALNPGLYVYHCATPHVPIHIANGMYGLILVEPEQGLPRADREYVVFNGRMGALLDKGAMRAKVGEKVRLFVGNGGPNLVSSFHVIGEIFDRVGSSAWTCRDAPCSWTTASRAPWTRARSRRSR